jgi:hypothetical protein
VWDIRTKNNVHTLTGHNQTVVGLGTQALEPQVTSCPLPLGGAWLCLRAPTTTALEHQSLRRI